MTEGRIETEQRLQWTHSSAIMAMIERMHSSKPGRFDPLKFHPDYKRRVAIEVSDDDPESKQYFKEAVLAAVGER